MKYELPTIDGKVIKLNKAELQISSNERIDTGYFVNLKLTGILPSCKKSQILTINHGINDGTVCITTVFNHRKWHEVKYEEMKKMIESLPVVPYIINPVTITPELEAFAKEEKIALYGRE